MLPNYLYSTAYAYYRLAEQNAETLEENEAKANALVC